MIGSPELYILPLRIEGMYYAAVMFFVEICIVVIYKLIYEESRFLNACTATEISSTPPTPFNGKYRHTHGN